MVTLADRGKHTERFGVHEERSKNILVKTSQFKKEKMCQSRERGDGGLPVLCC